MAHGKYDIDKLADLAMLSADGKREELSRGLDALIELASRLPLDPCDGELHITCETLATLRPDEVEIGISRVVALSASSHAKGEFFTSVRAVGEAEHE